MVFLLHSIGSTFPNEFLDECFYTWEKSKSEDRLQRINVSLHEETNDSNE